MCPDGCEPVTLSIGKSALEWAKRLFTVEKRIEVGSASDEQRAQGQ